MAMITVIEEVMEEVEQEAEREGVMEEKEVETAKVSLDKSHSQMLGKFEYTLPAKF